MKRGKTLGDKVFFRFDGREEVRPTEGARESPGGESLTIFSLHRGRIVFILRVPSGTAARGHGGPECRRRRPPGDSLKEIW